MKQHFFTIDTQGQREIEAREVIEELDELGAFGEYTTELCNTCTKKENCTAGELGEPVAECSDYGAPN